MMRAVSDKVVVEVNKTAREETKNGIVIPLKLRDLPYNSGKVLSIGLDVPSEIKVNDTILFHRNAGQVITDNLDVEYRVLRFDEIYCVEE